MYYNLRRQIAIEMIINTFIVLIILALIVNAIGNWLCFIVNFKLRIVIDHPGQY